MMKRSTNERAIVDVDDGGAEPFPHNMLQMCWLFQRRNVMVKRKIVFDVPSVGQAAAAKMDYSRAVRLRATIAKSASDCEVQACRVHDSPLMLRT